MSATTWTPEERAELGRIEAGRPSPPDPRLRYVLTDCFVCGRLEVRRYPWNLAARTCAECGVAVAPVTVAQLAPGLDAPLALDPYSPLTARTWPG